MPESNLNPQQGQETGFEHLTDWALGDLIELIRDRGDILLEDAQDAQNIFLEMLNRKTEGLEPSERVRVIVSLVDALLVSTQ